MSRDNYNKLPSLSLFARRRNLLLRGYPLAAFVRLIVEPSESEDPKMD
jgi:hypothetical protein